MLFSSTHGFNGNIMKKRKLKFSSTRRRTQQKAKHLRTLSRQKMFFAFIQPAE